ncbi:MAG TPA: hypothetical protein VFG10_06410 [Saprospiraceae bacterium]|nr:hypothetical protein [Saprospiraceae bacterium]
MKNSIVNSPIMLLKLFCVFVLLFAIHYQSSAQMPPPGYERAKKVQDEQMKVSILDRDSLTMTDTVVVFDPSTYEEETKIVNTRFSLRDYCLKYLGINGDILLDRNPHTIIDPKTFEDITVQLNPAGKIVIVPK